MKNTVKLQYYEASASRFSSEYAILLDLIEAKKKICVFPITYKF